MKTTVVTMYISPNGGSSDEYIEKGRRLMAVNHPMIVTVGDEKARDAILQMREGKQTVVHVCPLDQLYFYRYRELIEQNRRMYWPTRDERCSSDIHIILLSKFKVRQKAMEDNPFHTEYFAWMDFNMLTKKPYDSDHYTSDAVYEKLDQIFMNPRPNVTMTVIKYWDPAIYDRLLEFYHTYRYIVVGMFYTAEISIGKKVMEKVVAFAEFVTKQGFGHGEEHLFGRIIDQNVDDFTLVMGDYQDTIHNYYQLSTNRHYVLPIMKEMKRNERFYKLLRENSISLDQLD